MLKRILYTTIAYWALSPVLALAGQEPNTSELNGLPEVPATVRVKMGEHIFAIPRKAGSISFRNHHTDPDSMVDYPGWGKQQPDDPPYEVTTFSFLPNLEYEPHTPDISGVVSTMQILAYRTSTSNAYDSYEKIIKRLEEEEKTIGDLSDEEGFYAIPKPGGATYIPTQPQIRTPKGNPLAFSCNNGFCGTVFMLKDDVKIQVRQVGLYQVPREEWENYFNTLVTYLNSLEVKP